MSVIDPKECEPPLSASGSKATPVTLLTGFLGSGKTTLLNDLLADPRMRETAVVINEFGSVAVDHNLIHEGREGYISTSTGCLCCTATSDVRESLHELHAARERGNIPDFKRVIIETTGLADPAPIINSLIPGGAPAVAMRDHVVARAFQLTGVITTFDAEYGEVNIGEHFECWKQLAFADHIVLTKTDLASGTKWKTDLSTLNPTAVIHDRQAPGFDPVPLFGTRLYSTTDKPEDVPGWLAMERFSDPDGHAHEHDPDRHGAAIRALPLFHDEPLDPGAVDRFLKIMTSQPHAGLLRLKGIFALSDDPSRPLVAHAVQHRLYPPVRLDYWPGIDVRSRAIVIGNNLPVEPVKDLFDALRPKQRRRWFSRT
jgi:G3E family GTPase